MRADACMGWVWLRSVIDMGGMIRQSTGRSKRFFGVVLYAKISSMPQRLPPLNAVRAFCAAARCGSFTRAADELYVTPGAVSRQVQALEAHLGKKLFVRGVREIALTEVGAAFYSEAGAALEQIAHAAQRQAGDAIRLVVNVRPSFAQKWLIPRLPQLLHLHERIVLDVQTSLEPPDRCSAFDVAVRHSACGWPTGVELHQILDDELLLVGPVDIATGEGLNALLARFPVVQSRTRPRDWQRWLASSGHSAAPTRLLQLDYVGLVVQAVIEGVGIAAVPLSLVGADLVRGRVLDLEPHVRVPLRPYFCGVGVGAPPEAAGLVRWLKRAAAPWSPVAT
jgi:LysR family glycine cleavage system transcriptional activator